VKTAFRGGVIEVSRLRGNVYEEKGGGCYLGKTKQGVGSVYTLEILGKSLGAEDIPLEPKKDLDGKN